MVNLSNTDQINGIIYFPDDSIFDKTWQLPMIEKLE